MKINWMGNGVEEKGVDAKTGKVLIEIDPIYFRLNEVDFLQGDATKARTVLGWKPKVTFAGLAQLMAKADFEYVMLDPFLKGPSII